MAAATDRGVPLSTLCPKFLHTNSTSHTWPFSAIAELIDNAYDPDVSAKQLWIDKTIIQGEECLYLMDNGNGLDQETMHKMLSFGYSDKTAVNGVEPIGTYGNGFKSGSMRLGRDAIVFSKSKSTSCIGMLSQTYLEKIGAQQISVPIVCFDQKGSNQFFAREEHSASLRDIMSYSPFATKEELITELNAISHPFCTKNTGTRIIIWNLRRTTNGTLEFDFEKDRYDIRIPDDVYEAINKPNQNADKATSYIPDSVCSLRAYCSILYLKPRMHIVIRGQKVKSQLIAKSLACIRKDYYKPTFLNRQRISITFGYNTKSKDQYGIMMYHKNRLIKAYERVGCQLKANNQGIGVIGVIECNFLDPTHNKQSFNETDKYRKTISNLGTKLEEYWKEIRYRWNNDNPDSTTSVEDAMKRPDQNWVQCDDCLRWRKLPDGIDCSKLPDKWFCHLNPDPQFRSCNVQQELEDSDDEQTTYRKTYKLEERENKKQEKERQRDEEERKHKEKIRLANLTKQTKDLRQRHEKIKQQLFQATLDSPSTPMSRSNIDSLQGGAARAESTPLRSSNISQAACSPSSYSGLPVITSVCSLSPGNVRGKRTQIESPHTTPKRPRINVFQRLTSDTPSSVNLSPVSSPSVPCDNSDDDIFILETVSTPKPNKSEFDLSKVKTEQHNADVNMRKECSDGNAVDVKLETNAFETSSTGPPAVATSPTPEPFSELASVTTQTEMMKVKKEEEDQNPIEKEAGQSTMNKGASGDNQEENTLQNKAKHHPERGEAGPIWADSYYQNHTPSNYPSITEVEEQQDQLLEMMQVTAQERDSFKEQVCKLTQELKDMQSRLKELSQIRVKKEYTHQASQTEETEGREDYKMLFEKAKQKIHELIEEKKASQALNGSKPSNDPSEDKDIEEIGQQVESLLRELDKTNKEKVEMHAQLARLEKERANLASQCEQLKQSLQQQRENNQEVKTTPGGAADPEVAGKDSGTDSSSNAMRSLIELRQNVGYILVQHVPALDLNQVNYGSNVIDEILEQYVMEQTRNDE